MVHIRAVLAVSDEVDEGQDLGEASSFANRLEQAPRRWSSEGASSCDTCCR